jgi:hypothetical protein
MIVISGLSNIFAGTIDPQVSDDKYIEYGTQHKCIVEINGVFCSDPKIKCRASAVIVKPQIILTAAHVVKPIQDCYITVNDKKIKVLLSVMLDSFSDSELGPNDIAVCYLENKVDLDFYPELYSDNDEIGKVCSISGFGFTGTYDKGVSKFDGKKRAGSNKIDCLTNNMLCCSVNTKPKTSLEFMIANGDSGGGLFIDKKLAGINSSIMTNDGKLDSNYNEESLHTRISLHKKWIEFIIEKFEALEKD